MPTFNATVETKFEFEISCENCGADLCSISKIGNAFQRILYIKVKPCPNCSERAVEKSHKNGFEIKDE